MVMSEVLYVLLILGLLIFLVCSSVYNLVLLYSWLNGAPYVRTNSGYLDKIFSSLDIRKGQTLIELGCGDGQVVRYVVKKYDLRGLGVDINPILVYIAKIITFFHGIKNSTFKVASIQQTDIRNADYIYLYLYPSFILKIQDKLLEETKNGAVIISYGFSIKKLDSFLLHIIKDKPFSTFFYRISKEPIVDDKNH